MKLYYLFLLLMFLLLEGCTFVENSRYKKIDRVKCIDVIRTTIDSHNYLLYNRSLTHSGSCRKQNFLSYNKLVI